MTDDEPGTDAPAQGTCTFTPDELDIPQYLRVDLADWRCSRPVWEGTDSERCVWHAEQADKPPDELAATVKDGEIAGARVRESDLTTVSFPEGSILVGAILTDAILVGADLTNANLVGADLTNANLVGATLTDANLVDATLTDAKLGLATLTDANLVDATLTDANLVDATLTNANLRGADLTDANLGLATLTNANLQSASLTNAILLDATLTNAILLDATLTNAKLQSAILTDANLGGAILTDANLGGADLTNANLQSATLTNANLQSATLTNANLRFADLTDGDLYNATLQRANLEDASLSHSDLDRADITDAMLHNCRLLDVYISDETVFGTRCAYERAADPYDLLPWYIVGPSMEQVLIAGDDHRLYRGGVLTAAWHRFWYWTHNLRVPFFDTNDGRSHENAPWHVVGPSMESVLLADDDHHLHWVDIRSKENGVLDTVRVRLRYWVGEFFPAGSPDIEDVENLEKAASVYRTYQQLHRQNALVGQIGEYHYRAREMRRLEALTKEDPLQWLSQSLQRWVMGYGERPRRVVGTSLVAIVGFGLVYPFVGGMEAEVSAGTTNGTEVLKFTEVISLPLAGSSRILFENLYFSAVTFTTLGYGDIQPASTVTQLLASVESFIGTLLMALLVAVLARQTMR